MSNKYIMVSMHDSNAKKLAEVLGNDTCRKMIDYLSEIKEASESDISKSLNIPLNTVGYNIKKLIETGLIERTKNHFWSTKGKKVPLYKVSNKSILITPKSRTGFNKFTTSIITLAATGAVAVVIAGIESTRRLLQGNSESGVAAIAEYAGEAVSGAAGSSASSGVAADAALKTMPSVFPDVATNVIQTTSQMFPSWLLFLAGGILALAIAIILNWKKI